MNVEDFDECTDLNQVPKHLQERVKQRAIARRIAAMPSNLERHRFLALLGKHHSQDVVQEIRRIAWDILKARNT